MVNRTDGSGGASARFERSDKQCVIPQKQVSSSGRVWRWSASLRSKKRCDIIVRCSLLRSNFFAPPIDRGFRLALSRCAAHPDGQIFRYLYILVAVLLWPFLTPLASALAEPDPRKRPARLILFVAGLVLTAYLAFKLANATGIDVKVVGHSLSYVIGYDAPLPMFVHCAYAAIAIIPLVTLRNRALNVIEILVAGSFLYTFLEMKEVRYSVWCLAAAVASVLFFFSIAHRSRWPL